MPALVCFALPDEARFFKRTDAASRVRILVHGMGRQNAEHAIRAALAGGVSVSASRSSAHEPDQSRLGSPLAPPDLVLTCGFAGGLDPGLAHGEVLFELGSSRGNEAQIEIGNQLEPRYVGCYEKLVAAGARPGKFHCADRVAVTAAEKRMLRQATGADAVEMESGVIQAVCREHGISCATVRVISDVAGEDLPLDFNALMTPDMKLDAARVALAALKSPRKIGALLRLQKHTSAAAEKLAAVLARVTRV